jgi:hypothetical protein
MIRFDWKAIGLFFSVATIFLSSPAPAFAQSVSFSEAPGSPVGVGNAPATVVAYDFNGDGKMDLAVANTNDNNVTILLGNGDGTFNSAGTFGTTPFGIGQNQTPIAIAVGDFNDDGIPDLAVTTVPTGFLNAGSVGGLLNSSPGGGVSILLGKGDGTFTGGGPFNNPNNFGTNGNLPIGIAVGRFDTANKNDQNLDLAITHLNSGNVSIMIGDGKGNFSLASASPFSVGTNPAGVAVGDFNGDGKSDLAVANADDGTVSILLGNGDGTFSANATIAVGVRPVAVAIADFNGDGNMDIAVANYSSDTVSVLLGNGLGSFTVSTLSAGRHPFAIAVGDFNQDGHPDLIVANRSGNLVSVMLGNGDGTFAAPANFAVDVSPQSLAIADFNGDSAPDVAALSTPIKAVTILLNKTDLVPPVTVATPSPGPNGNGWNNTAVTVTLTSTDNEPNGTGVREIHYAIGAGSYVVVPGASASVAFTTEGIFTLSYFAIDNAGNVENTHTLTIRIDLTPPTITAAQSPLPNAAGWNNSNVTVTFTCGDALSGVAICPPPVVVSTEGANQQITGTATDRAGNSASATITINLDKTPPVLTMPSLAASYIYNSSLTFTFSATDALSGVATSQATFNGQVITTGTTVVLNHPATNTFTFTATDVAGNTAAQTKTFSVLYNFSGFLPPIPNDGSGVYKLGSTVPVKFQLTDANGAVVSTAVATLAVQMFSGGVPLGVPENATPPGNADIGNAFRFSSPQYIYNLSTKPLMQGTWQIQASLDDGTVHTVFFGLK